MHLYTNSINNNLSSFNNNNIPRYLEVKEKEVLIKKHEITNNIYVNIYYSVDTNWLLPILCLYGKTTLGK